MPSYLDPKTGTTTVAGPGGEWVWFLTDLDIRRPTIRQPTAPPIDDGKEYYANGGNGDVIILFDPATGPVSNIKIWLFGDNDNVLNVNFADVTISPDGTTYQTPISLYNPYDVSTVSSWFSANFPVAWTQAQVSNMRLKITQKDNGNIELFQVYAEVTYSGGPANKAAIIGAL